MLRANPHFDYYSTVNTLCGMDICIVPTAVVYILDGLEMRNRFVVVSLNECVRFLRISS